jgi:peptide/nickel transport system permease protein
VVFARARGIAARKVLIAYAFRNALVPVVTSAGLILGYLLTGGILVEVAFSLPGIGALMIDGVSNKDLPVVQGVALVIAAIVILANLAIDILYLMIDPRIRLRAAA